MYDFKVGDRVRFRGRSKWAKHDMLWTPAYPDLEGCIAVVVKPVWDTAPLYLSVSWVERPGDWVNGGYYIEDFEPAEPLTAFDQSVCDYIRRELHD